MINVEGYKAFHGTMRIESKSKCVPVIEIEGDWLYKPHTNTWHCNGSSYPAKFCTVVSDSADRDIAKKLLPDNRYYGIGMCPNCGVVFTSKGTKYCGNCGQALDLG